MTWWVVFNWMGYIVIMGFMHHMLTTRYTVSLPVSVMIYGGWAILLGLTYYIFVIRLKRGISHPSNTG